MLLQQRKYQTAVQSNTEFIDGADSTKYHTWMDIVWSLCRVSPDIILSTMQIQNLFALLRIFHLTLNQRSSEANSFPWDGLYDLPTIQLNLYIMTSSCVPSYDVFESLLIEINTLVTLYPFFLQPRLIRHRIPLHDPCLFTIIKKELDINTEDVIIILHADGYKNLLQYVAIPNVLLHA